MEGTQAVTIWTIAANVLGCASVQLGLARLFTVLPDRYFSVDRPLFKEISGERYLYRRILHIQSWKTILPDGAAWVGSKFSKRRIQSTDFTYLTHFALETRRGEAAHWAMICCAPLFYLWNPAWACWVITAYMVASNMPCIVAQRYNRFAIARILKRRRA